GRNGQAEGYAGDHTHGQDARDRPSEFEQGDSWEPPKDDKKKPPQAALREIDAEDLLAQEAPQLEYLPLLNKDGYFVVGWSHLLAGFPRSGKTELMLACVKQWLALGLAVLYLTEESEALWRQRLGRHPGPWRGLRLVFGLGELPSVLLARMVRADQPVIVCDTLRNLGIL